MVTENLQPTAGASGVGLIATRFWPGDRIRYCVVEYWICGEHSADEFCVHCKKRAIAFRRRKDAAFGLIDKMLAAAGA